MSLTQDELAKAHGHASAATARLRLPLRSKVWRGQAGEFMGAGVGSSLDFQDHRTYVPGDDPRHINWQAYARTGTYTMKLYREEVRPVVDVVLDASESMFFDSAKATRAAELFYFVVESARRSGASTTVHLVRGDTARATPAEGVDHHRWLEEARSLKSKDGALPPDLSRIAFRQNAIRVFVSDLLFEANPEPILHFLAARQGSPILLVPHCATESNPDWAGNFEFIDAERKSRHPHRIEPTVLKRYKATYAKHFALWKQTAQRHRSAFARVAAEPDLQTALFAEAVPTGALEIAH